MQKINFILKKNKDIIINEKNIKCLNNNKKLTFKINDIKYTYYNNILKEETEEETIELDFNKEIATIYLKEYKNNLVLNLTDVKIKNTEKKEKIVYKIETEENNINIITIEYIKNS